MAFTPEQLKKFEAEELALSDGLRAAGATDAELEAIIDAPWSIRVAPADELASYRRKQDELHARKRQLVRDGFIKAGAPEFHLRHVFDVEPEASEALDAALQFVADDSLFLLLLGGVGTRKTGAAVAALTKANIPAPTFRSASRADYLFVTADALARLGGFDKADELAKLETCYLLVIDDLGAEYGDAKGWFSSLFGALINKRYGGATKTIITSNLTADQIKAQYGERVADRIRESGRVINVTGKSMRTRRLPKNWIEPMPAQEESFDVDLGAVLGIKPGKGSR